MNHTLWIGRWLLAAQLIVGVQAQDVRITVKADEVKHRLSRYLTGACLEDVNHEVYGGIDSQMIFGESFAEGELPVPLKGFNALGGRWVPMPDGSLQAAGGDGPKLLVDTPTFDDGEVSVELRFGANGNGNAGLILRVSQARSGADQFNGYEVSLEPSGTLVLGRHRQNWEPLRRVACAVPLNEWIKLAVRLKDNTLQVSVNGKPMTEFEDTEHPLAAGVAGLRTWQLNTQFRNLSLVKREGPAQPITFVYAYEAGWGRGVSGMWRPFRRGAAKGEFALERLNAFSGDQSQRLIFLGGQGEVGIENQGLNRWGMHFVQGKSYEGYLWAQADFASEMVVALESGDGSRIYAEKKVQVPAGGWRRVDFALKPKVSDQAGRFAVKLRRPGAVCLGYALLQPASWGRFRGLPVRKDVAEGLIDQGITILRQGGCMVNANEYRWKKMIGPRAQRPTYAGWWYPHSSNGWGIFEFLQFCEAAGFVAVPDVNVNETPQDMADFIEYANGSSDTEWGRKRARDGHPKPYGLKHLQIGNEEKVDEAYWLKFKGIAEAIWAKDPQIILVVGDFAYGHRIKDPFQITGAAGGISTLAAHQKILQLAKEHGREVWFDVHIGTDGPKPDFGGTLSYIDALEKLADGAKHRVVIFEFNAGNHSQRRALANAAAINAVERDGRLPMAVSANCLQPDGQNDNGWNQGLLFLNPSQVWLQPPGYVTRMVSRNYQPLLVASEVHGADGVLDVSAKRSEDGKRLVLQVANAGGLPVPASVQLGHYVPSRTQARVETLAGPLHAVNTATNTTRITPIESNWRHGIENGKTAYTFEAHSFTIIRFE